MFEDVLWQVDADKDHTAFALLVASPFGAQIAAHELVHTLEDNLAGRSLHVKNALVAQHFGAVDIDDGAQEIFELGGVERTICTVDKTFHIIVVVMVVRVIAVLAMFMVVIVIVVVIAIRNS